MFGLFQAKPPLSPWEKAWTEHRLGWFADQLGFTCVLERETLLPHDPRLPEVTDAASAQTLLEFLAKWMGYQGRPAGIQIYGDVVPPEQVQTLDADQLLLRAHPSQFNDRDALIASLAWQLGHELMSNGTLRDVEPTDQAWCTDLLPVFFGLGIFVANHTLREPEKDAHHFAWWGKRQRAYLPARIFGYALALRESIRGTDPQAVADALRPDVQTAFRDALRYLQKTGDTTFSRETTRQHRERLAVDVYRGELRQGSPSRRISAMWCLADCCSRLPDTAKQQIAEQLLDQLRSKEPEVRAVAAATLPSYDRSAHAAQDLADALRDSSDEVRIAAASALASYPGVDDETLVFDLREALKDGERLVVFNAARSLTRFGNAAQSAVPELLKRMRQALVECRDDDALLLLASTNAITNDASQLVDEYFRGQAPEYREMMHQLWDRLKDAAETDTVANPDASLEQQP